MTNLIVDLFYQVPCFPFIVFLWVSINATQKPIIPPIPIRNRTKDMVNGVRENREIHLVLPP
jgi:hypothetical protein